MLSFKYLHSLNSFRENNLSFILHISAWFCCTKMTSLCALWICQLSRGRSNCINRTKYESFFKFDLFTFVMPQFTFAKSCIFIAIITQGDRFRILFNVTMQSVAKATIQGVGGGRGGYNLPGDEVT